MTVWYLGFKWTSSVFLPVERRAVLETGVALGFLAASKGKGPGCSTSCLWWKGLFQQDFTESPLSLDPLDESSDVSARTAHFPVTSHQCLA